VLGAGPFENARTMRTRSIAVFSLLSLPAFSSAQAPPVPAAAAARSVGAGMLHLNVSNMDQSLAFYRDVLGLEMRTPPTAPRAAAALVSQPGALLKTAVLRVQGGAFQLELVEWIGTPLRPQQMRIQDAGAVMLAMDVGNLDAKLNGARKLGLRVLTDGGQPVAFDGPRGKTRTVMIRDADGFVVELVESQAPASAAPAPGEIHEVSMYVTVADLARTVAFYTRAFGFDMAAAPEARPTPPRLQAFFGDRTLATMRTARGTFPGSDVTLNFQEFGAPDRKAVRHRVQDPGGPIFPVTVNDLPAVIEQIKANGGSIGVDETTPPLAADARSTWIRDPNGVLIQISLPPGSRLPAPGSRN
jgi:catechol 2,3-dioxygenase-like lactoylglutathione lyase family enzyme